MKDASSAGWLGAHGLNGWNYTGLQKVSEAFVV